MDIRLKTGLCCIGVTICILTLFIINNNLGSHELLQHHETLKIIIAIMITGISITILMVLISHKTISHLNNVSKTAKCIAQGDFSCSIMEKNSYETVILSDSLKLINNGVSDFYMDIMETARAVEHGKWETRLNEDKFKGNWKEMSIQINNLIAGFTEPVYKTSDYLDRLARGEIPRETIEANLDSGYKNEFDNIINNINLLTSNLRGTVLVTEKIAQGDLSICVNMLSDNDAVGKSLSKMLKTINSIINDINCLTDSALEGKLDIRGDENKFGGVYDGIIMGVNNILDAVSNPLNLTAEYLDRMSKGEIPEIITQEYRGDFNTIKNNLNTLIENLGKTIKVDRKNCRRRSVC